jgi:transketolase
MSEQTTTLAGRIRRLVLDHSHRAGVGHIGSSLSIADILAALFGDVLPVGGLDDPDRDRFVLSKGHAALALYAVLHETGRLTLSELATFGGDGSVLGTHPEHVAPGVDFSTGSLGHGLSMGAGAALAARLQGSSRRTYVLVSDAECNEGSLWEAVMFAAHHRLGNLVVIVDENGQQALGMTGDVLDLAPLGDRWRSFGWDVHEVDGHDVDALVSTFRSLERVADLPHVILARTILGKGVSYMERQIAWHYWPMSDDQYRQACEEIGE